MTSLKASPLHYEMETLARSLKLASVDRISTPNVEIESHWYQSEGPADLFFWVSGGKLVKHQLNLYGQIIEWNQFDGIKTGYVQEEDFPDGTDVTEMVCFDPQPNPYVTKKALEFLHEAEAIDLGTRQKIGVHYESYFLYKKFPGWKFLRRLYSIFRF